MVGEKRARCAVSGGAGPISYSPYLKVLIQTLREHGVRRFKDGDLEIELSDFAYQKTPIIDNTAQLERIQNEEDPDIAFLSSGLAKKKET